MATNSGHGFRHGAVKGKSQVFNPKTGLFAKKDNTTGRFQSVKKSGGAYKGVSKK